MSSESCHECCYACEEVTFNNGDGNNICYTCKEYCCNECKPYHICDEIIKKDKDYYNRYRPEKEQLNDPAREYNYETYDDVFFFCSLNDSYDVCRIDQVIAEINKDHRYSLCKNHLFKKAMWALLIHKRGMYEDKIKRKSEEEKEEREEEEERKLEKEQCKEEEETN